MMQKDAANENTIEKILGYKPRKITPLNEGVSNFNYLVDEKNVIRIKNESDTFYNAKYESEIYKKIKNLNIAENVILIDNDGNKLSEYMLNIKHLNYEDNQIEEIAKVIKKLHQSKIKVKAKFNPIKRYKYYFENSGEKIHFKHERFVIDKFKKIYRTSKKTLCHNDLVNNNFLFVGQKMYLIDYEYSGMNIPVFDLASFLTENNIKDKQKIEKFLDTYKPSDKEIKGLPYVAMFLNLLWYYWALERYQKTKRKIFLDISADKKNNIANDLKSLLIFN